MHETIEIHDCKEIKKLKAMLEDENIPHESLRRHGHTIKGYEIFYPNQADNIYTVKEEIGSLGYDSDTLQLTYNSTQEITHGFMTAEDVFKNIKNHFEENK